MCAIVGGVFTKVPTGGARVINAALTVMCGLSRERGRDGFGYETAGRLALDTPFYDARWHIERNTPAFAETVQFIPSDAVSGYFIANLRAEPTTEYVKEKCENDQQPYSDGNWTIVHNGTIANDKEIRTGRVHTDIDSAAIVELMERIEGLKPCETSDDAAYVFEQAVLRLKGSYAILAVHSKFPKIIFAAANYRPIWYIKTQFGFFFASSRSYFPAGQVPQMMGPYTMSLFDASSMTVRGTTIPREPSRKALVVCSGGLDSVVAATMMKRRGMQVELIHFMYGSRAEGPEVAAIQEIARELDVPLTLFPLPVYKKTDSPLLDHNSQVAGGEAGAEFAHEWVPARNLLLLSVATAYAEANGFGTVVLGNNLEEAGAYPDNEPEFISKFNDLLPFAIGDGKDIQVAMPVGNYMKHEIVKLGMQIGAPLHLTWSCYRAGQRHCGRCGPCFMRRTAFEINGIPEVIEYEE